jgi:hypothetical protein
MKKNMLNYIIDIFMFILMMAIIGIGFLMKFILITGQEKWIIYGRNVEETFLGLDRHGWGKIHLIFGLMLVAVLILHLILHWRSITRFFKNAFANMALRISCVSLLLLVGIMLIIFPFLAKPKVAALEAGHRQFYREEQYINPDTSLTVSSDDIPLPGIKGDRIPEDKARGEEEYHQKRVQREQLKTEIEVKGFMTIKEVSGKYNVQADQIKKRIGIPLSISNNERLGRLRQRYGFTMNDVVEAIDAEPQK